MDHFVLCDSHSGKPGFDRYQRAIAALKHQFGRNSGARCASKKRILEGGALRFRQQFFERPAVHFRRGPAQVPAGGLIDVIDCAGWTSQKDPIAHMVADKPETVERARHRHAVVPTLRRRAKAIDITDPRLARTIQLNALGNAEKRNKPNTAEVARAANPGPAPPRKAATNTAG